MTGLEFRNYVLEKFVRTDKDDELYHATTDVIADMRIQFDSEDYKEEAFNTSLTTGDYKVGLPVDFGHIIGHPTLIDTSSDQEYGQLKKISKAEYDHRYADRLLSSNQFTGVPCDYCIFGDQIFVGPAVDSDNYKIQFNYTTEDFSEITSATADVPFSSRYRNILRAGVLAELNDGLELYEEANYWRTRYTVDLAKIRDNDEQNVKDETTVAYHGI